MQTILKYILYSFLLFPSLINGQKISDFSVDYVEQKMPFGLIEKRPKCMPKVALALSGGGSRGLAQLGVLKALSEADISLDAIVGTSMGSIIGGLYSIGYSIEEMDSIILNTNWNDFFSFGEKDRRELFVEQKIIEDRSLFELRLEGLTPVLPTSFNTGQKVASFLNLLVLNAPVHVTDTFDELLFQYRAISTDLKTGNSVIMERGSLSQAMRASSSVTFLLAPVNKDSMMLVDGGLVANIPVKEAKELGAEFIIAVNTTSPLRSEDELKYPWNIADQVVSIPMKMLNEQQINESDYLIEPQLNDRKNSDFTNISNIIETGYSSAKEAVPYIKQKLDSLYVSHLGEDNRYFKSFSFEGEDIELIEELEEYFVSKDSVSLPDIKKYLCNKLTEGDHDDISAAFLISDALKVTIKSKLNPIVTAINVENAELIDSNDLLEPLQYLLYKPYNSREVLKSSIALLSKYRTKGFPFVTIDSIGFYDGDLRFYLREGKVDDIQISGNLKTVESVVKREVPVNKGDIATINDLDEGLINLRGSNLFEESEFAYQFGSSSDTFRVNVRERQSSLFRFGLKIDNENFTQLLFDIRDENLFGSGSEIGLTLFGGSRTRSYILEHRADRILDTYLTYKVRAFYEFDDVNVYRDDSTTSQNEFSRSKTGEYRQIYKGISLGVGTQIEKVASLIFEGRFKNDEVKNKYDYTGETYKLDISSLRISLSIDSQDKYPYPVNGFLVKGYYETAQNIFGGDISYTKTELDYRAYIGINKAHNINARINIGVADETLPLSQQFSLGGQNSFFGYREDEFRGRQIFIASLAYRLKLPVRLFFDTYLKTRYDLGSIWAEKKQIRFQDLRHGLGATLSLDTPLGPADFSVGKSFIIQNSLLESTISWGQTFFYFTIGYYY
jgi:NTE family protein